MPERYLPKLRRWRTWLLIVTGAGQGAQWVLAPSRALSTPAYAATDVIGTAGWRTLGAGLVVVSLLMLAGGTTRYLGHALGAALYLLLTAACAVNLYWPSLLVLAAGLHLGEFWLWARLRAGDGD